MRPGTVLGEFLHERQAAEDPAPLLLRVFEDAGGQRGHADLADLQSRAASALSHRSSEARSSSTTSNSSSSTGSSPVTEVSSSTAEITAPPVAETVTSGGRPPATSWMKTRKRRSVLRFGRRVPGRIQQAKIGDPLRRAQESAGAKNALDLGDFGARRQAVRRERVSYGGRHGGLLSGTLAGRIFIFYSCRE